MRQCDRSRPRYQGCLGETAITPAGQHDRGVQASYTRYKLENNNGDHMHTTSATSRDVEGLSKKSSFAWQAFRKRSLED